MEILLQIPGARAQVDSESYPLSPSNAGVGQNFITAGGATLARFIVPPPQRIAFGLMRFVVAPRSEFQGRCLQLRKENI
ncbi:MAG: hypothetical protein UY26_C0003G0289 [Candidatus Jorgensenbacteria bacterium GW2011_GWA1_48_13]|uniref:Uncharacterized protein n=1 Tax=Candidatus Jorgensenbacteria bacterium GW2011_GWB1_50_10 TaxID=1618665 RepID=A0A0G1W7Y8_9BACT|nr:MAG: hypothetical protein UY26_C0003G0289 [Candidatus Jorgensenbacteria bacterium GW2011_GWA1_48_13]KKW14823.1 MAG: hypothetical protein UY55_C0003G0039 [Candidatus Jorgensenbacteria bacterium GW2011_GWB1_50_10]